MKALRDAKEVFFFTCFLCRILSFNNIRKLHQYLKRVASSSY